MNYVIEDFSSITLCFVDLIILENVLTNYNYLEYLHKSQLIHDASFLSSFETLYSPFSIVTYTFPAPTVQSNSQPFPHGTSSNIPNQTMHNSHIPMGIPWPGFPYSRASGHASDVRAQ